MRLSLAGWHFFVAAAFAATPPAWAQEKIGIAVIVRNDVSGMLLSRTVPISPGEDVFGKEIVKTGPESSAKLVFADSTNLAVGPNASVTLDKFVFSGPTDYKKAAVTLVRGAFRFTTGTPTNAPMKLKQEWQPFRCGERSVTFSRENARRSLQWSPGRYWHVRS